jgi:hypothetical protein
MKTETDLNSTSIGWNQDPLLVSAGAVVIALVRVLRIVGLVGVFFFMLSVAATANV